MVSFDKQTAALLIGLVGSGGVSAKMLADISDVRERIARIEARLDYGGYVARTDDPAR